MALSNHRILKEKEPCLSQEEKTVPARSEKDATADGCDGLEGDSRQGTRQFLVPSERVLQHLDFRPAFYHAQPLLDCEVGNLSDLRH